MVSAVSPRGELHFQVEEGIRKEEFLEFWKVLVEDMKRPVFLILDNSQVHRSKILKEYVEQSSGMLTVFFLPPYSPDLNPDEWDGKTSGTTTSGAHQSGAKPNSHSTPRSRSLS